MSRMVWIDDGGFTDGDWLAAIVRAPTGVFYRHQYGGTACRQGTIQGYIVPVFSRPAITALTSLFEETLQGAGAPPRAWPTDLLAVLREAVSQATMSPSVHTDYPDPAEPLALDEEHLADADEASRAGDERRGFSQLRWGGPNAPVREPAHPHKR